MGRSMTQQLDRIKEEVRRTFFLLGAGRRGRGGGLGGRAVGSSMAGEARGGEGGGQCVCGVSHLVTWVLSSCAGS
jgi:hypothetical protein